MRRAAEAEAAAARRVALAGISFAAAPALLAGQGGGAELVLTLGGFHGLEPLAVFAATGGCLGLSAAVLLLFPPLRPRLELAVDAQPEPAADPRPERATDAKPEPAADAGPERV
jgi:hypothetical protein